MKWLEWFLAVYLLVGIGCWLRYVWEICDWGVEFSCWTEEMVVFIIFLLMWPWVGLG